MFILRSKFKIDNNLYNIKGSNKTNIKFLSFYKSVFYFTVRIKFSILDDTNLYDKDYCIKLSYFKYKKYFKEINIFTLVSFIYDNIDNDNIFFYDEKLKSDIIKNIRKNKLNSLFETN